ncbi:DUF397 domain-containing protein [Nonomuraea sp. NBC_00507]|uniref:DUF397 domain-containing protein n=1 Tax=Nonomuraea sp. NBC_00507 TaxID=2976002 RepID=UPI002E195EAB
MNEVIDPSWGGWRKSRHSMSNGDCVEVALFTDGRVGLRDSKNPSGGTIVLAAEEFRDLLTDIKQGKI